MDMIINLCQLAFRRPSECFLFLLFERLIAIRVQRYGFFLTYARAGDKNRAGKGVFAIAS